METKEDILFGELIKKLRLEKGVSLREVQDQTLISSSYLSRMENFSRDNPTLDIVSRLSRYFDIDFSTIAQLCKDGTSADKREIRDISNILLNEKYTFAQIEQSVEVKMMLRAVIKEIEIYCTKVEIKRDDGNKLINLVDILRNELLNA